MKSRWLILGFATVLTAVCGLSAVGCPSMTPCIAVFRQRPSGSVPLAVLLLLLGAGLLLPWFRMAWLLWRSAIALSRLPRCDYPFELVNAISRTGVEGVDCIASGEPVAFCAGIWRPKILVSQDLAGLLRPAELDAVLLHEAHHARRRDPLRRAAWRAAGDVFFFLPLLDWLARRQLVVSELVADRAALQQVGLNPLAGALWTLGSATGGAAVAAFGGAIGLRVAQLLGRPVVLERPEPILWARSATGLLLAAGVILCLWQMPMVL
ncbi:MAG: M56 family metallopeptidase [Chloroflexi bacterium]|nr:MAG: M56 family metallopeptidase [Chloroflexota bacterium]